MKSTVTDLEPRERLVLHGAECLSDAELVGLLLGHSVGADEMGKAADLLNETAGVTDLLNLDLLSLRYRGLSEAEAVSVLVAGELSRRQARQELVGEVMDAPETVARYLFLRFGHVGQEVMGTLFTDMRNMLIGESEIFRGTFRRAAVDPVAVIRQAVVRHAAGIVLFHNHPGGDPSPSQDDLDFTFRMKDACELMEVRLLDHVIVGAEGAWVSLRRRGCW